MEKNKKVQSVLSGIKTLALVLSGLGLSVAVTAMSPASALASDNELIGQEEAIVNLTNQIRVNAGLNELTTDSRLMTSARNKALDMATRGYFDHANPEGDRVSYWVLGAGYKYSLAGENLAKGFSSIDRLMSAWVNSFSHYVNLIEPKFKNIGIGIAEGIYQGQTTVFVVQHFGAEQASAVKIADGQSSSLKNFISPITNIITDHKTALAAPINVDEGVQFSEVAKSESIDAVSTNVETLPPSTGGSSDRMIFGLFAVMLLLMLSYLEDQFNILQIKKVILSRKIYIKKT